MALSYPETLQRWSCRQSENGSEPVCTAEVSLEDAQNWLGTQEQSTVPSDRWSTELIIFHTNESPMIRMEIIQRLIHAFGHAAPAAIATSDTIEFDHFMSEW